MDSFPSNLSPIVDPDRLLQDVDINRLRAVVFRDVVSDGGAVLSVLAREARVYTALILSVLARSGFMSADI